MAEVIKPAFLASSAANVERTDVMICCDDVEAANLSATSAAMAAAVFLEVSPVDVTSSILEVALEDDGLALTSTASLLSRLRMTVASSTWACATCPKVKRT